MPSGFMPKGIVANHSTAGSLSLQYCGDDMNASILPLEVASKQSSRSTICPPGKTSMRKRPPLISSTIFPSRLAAPCSRSCDATHVVDIRHCTFGWAMTRGASTTAVAAAAATAHPALTMNLRRSIIESSSRRHELVVGALGDVIPRPHQRLELRERRVHLPGHGRLLRPLLDDLGRQLPEVAQHRRRELDDLDLALELRLEPLQRDGV